MRKATFLLFIFIVFSNSGNMYSMQGFSALLHRSITGIQQTSPLIKTYAKRSLELTIPLAKRTHELCKNHARLLGGTSLTVCGLAAMYRLARSTMVHTIIQNAQERAAHQLLHSGNTNTLEWAIAHGADINEQFKGKTALHHAAIHGNAMYITALIARGAYIQALDSAGECAIYYAARNGHIAAIEQLLQAGASINDALQSASSTGQLAIVKWLIQHGADHTRRNVGGFTALGMATLYNQTEVTHYLQSLYPLQANGENDMRIHFTELLDQAIAGQSIIQARIALKSGTSLVKTDESQAPLRQAIARTSTAENATQAHEIVQALLEAGAPLQTVDAAGNTPLHMAAERGDIKIAQLLLHHGAKAYWQNTAGITALDIAFENYNADMQRLLAAHMTTD